VASAEALLSVRCLRCGCTNGNHYVDGHTEPTSCDGDDGEGCPCLGFEADEDTGDECDRCGDLPTFCTCGVCEDHGPYRGRCRVCDEEHAVDFEIDQRKEVVRG